MDRDNMCLVVLVNIVSRAGGVGLRALHAHLRQENRFSYEEIVCAIDEALCLGCIHEEKGKFYIG